MIIPSPPPFTFKACCFVRLSDAKFVRVELFSFLVRMTLRYCAHIAVNGLRIRVPVQLAAVQLIAEAPHRHASLTLAGWFK